MERADADRYLTHLGVARREPSALALTELVTAHLGRVPFENVSKLVRARRGEPAGVPALDRYLQDMERSGLGGTCYVLNPCLGELLRQLGYDVELRGCDMERPDVHVVNVVRLDGRDHLVDVGYAAPFLAPLALDAAPLRVERGPESWVLNPATADGRRRLDHLRGGEIVHGYAITPGARRPDEFTAIVADSFGSASSFMTSLRIVRHTPRFSLVLRDFTVREVVDGHQEVRELADRDALRVFVCERFGIAAGPVDEAMSWLEGRSEAWS